MASEVVSGLRQSTAEAGPTGCLLRDTPPIHSIIRSRTLAFSASLPLVSVRHRRLRLEDTCAQKGGACPTNEPGVGVGCSFAGLWVVGWW